MLDSVPQAWHDVFDGRYVVTESGCWEWTGGRRGNGYGSVSLGRRDREFYAHRASLEFASGLPLGDLCACHHCDNRICIRPSHLFAGTQGDNLRDAFAKGRLRVPDQCGEAGNRHKLTNADVALIRRSTETSASLAARYGVRACTIRRARSGRTFRNVPGGAFPMAAAKAKAA